MKPFIRFLAVALALPIIGFSQTTKSNNEFSSEWAPDKAPSKSLIKSTRLFRERLMNDPYRPAYHFAIPEDRAIPGDPNGAFYYNGRYHLMYLYNREGSGFSWGHISSKDLLHWRHHPDALAPGNGDDGVFSGGAFVDKKGMATLSYWQFMNGKTRESNAASGKKESLGIGIAQSNDEHFDTWTKSPANPVIQSTEWGITDLKDASGKDIHIGSADPSNIWQKDGRYYMLTGNLRVLRKYGSRGLGLPANMENGPELPADSAHYQGDQLYLFVSDNLKQWKYVHEFYKSDRRWTSKTEDNMCPSFLPLPSKSSGGKASDKHLLLFISHNKGCQYYIGDYKNDKFFPDTHGRMTWKDNAYFAPEALIDSNGRQIMWSWIFDDRPDSVKSFSGWTGTYGLPRSLWLGEDGTLRMQPVKELENLRQQVKVKKDITVKSGSVLDLAGFGKELLELEITLSPGSAEKVGVIVGASPNGREQTSLYYHAKDKKLMFDATKSSLGYGRKIVEEAPLHLKKGEPLVLRVFIDRSIVEVYANDRQAIARNVYPTLGGTGVKLFAEGGDMKVLSVKAWELMPSNPY